jgi:hypothetical protein
MSGWLCLSCFEPSQRPVRKADDFAAFERILAEGIERFNMFQNHQRDGLGIHLTPPRKTKKGE